MRNLRAAKNPIRRIGRERGPRASALRDTAAELPKLLAQGVPYGLPRRPVYRWLAGHSDCPSARTSRARREPTADHKPATSLAEVDSRFGALTALSSRPSPPSPNHFPHLFLHPPPQPL